MAEPEPIMTPIAHVEGYGWADGMVLLSSEVDVGTIMGVCHAGGDSQQEADELLRGYWIIAIEDRNRDGQITQADQPLNKRWLWFEVPPQTSDKLSGVRAIGWDGQPGNLLRQNRTLPLEKGKCWIVLAVAVSRVGDYSCMVSWPPGSEPNWNDLIGLTADGYIGKWIVDYSAVGFRVNRIDPPYVI